MAKYIDPGMRPSDKLIPWYFVAFFVVVFIANGFLIYFATESQPGVIEEHNYEIGITYDERIAEQDAEDALGWRSDVTLDGRHLSFSLKDADGKRLQGADVKAELIRTVQEGHDFEVVLKEESPGKYSADIDFPLPGQWDAYIYVTWDDQPYHTVKKLVVTP